MENKSRTTEVVFRDIEDVFTAAITSRDYGLALMVARKLSEKLVADIISGKDGVQTRRKQLYIRLSGLAELAFAEGMGASCRAIYSQMLEAGLDLRRNGTAGHLAFNELLDQFVARIVFATESETEVSEFLVTEVFPDRFYAILAEIPVESAEFERHFSTYLERMIAFARAGKNEAAIRTVIAMCIFPEKFRAITDAQIRWTRTYRYLRAVGRCVATGQAQSSTPAIGEAPPLEVQAKGRRLIIQGIVAGGIARDLIMEVGLLEEWKGFLQIVAGMLGQDEKITERASHELLESLAALPKVPAPIRERKREHFEALVKLEIDSIEKIVHQAVSAEDRDYLTEQVFRGGLKSSIVAGDIPIFNAVWDLAEHKLLPIIKESSWPEFILAFEHILLATLVFAKQVGAPAEIIQRIQTWVRTTFSNRKFSSKHLSYIVQAIFEAEISKERVLEIWAELRPQAG